MPAQVDRSRLNLDWVQENRRKSEIEDKKIKEAEIQAEKLGINHEKVLGLSHLRDKIRRGKRLNITVTKPDYKPMW